MLSIATFSATRPARSAPLDLIAKAQGQELSVERLARMMATSSIQLNKTVVSAVVDLWISYQLLGYAGAHGDTASDSASTDWWFRDTAFVDSLMWWNVLDARSETFFNKKVAELAMPDTSNLEQKYAASPMLAAQHILIMLPDEGKGMTQAKQDSARLKAEDIRRRVNADNFAALAKQYSEDPGSKDNGGSYMMFGPGTELTMVPEFEEAVRKAKPGEFAPGLVKTTYGYHIIRRLTFKEAHDAFVQALARGNVGKRMSDYVAQVRADWKVSVLPSSIPKARQVAANPAGARGDRTVIATSNLGPFTASRLADWIDVIPADVHIREVFANAPDSIVSLQLSQIVGQEVLDAQAKKENVHLTAEQTAIVRSTFSGMMTYAATGLRLDPVSLRDSATTVAQRERLAASRADAAIETLFAQNGKDMVDIGPQLIAALRQKYPSAHINHAAVDQVVERATAIRIALDTLRSHERSVGK